MRKYLFKSKKLYPYSFLLIADAINVALMAILLKQTLNAALSGNIRDLIITAIIIVIYLIEYTCVSWGTRTIKAHYIAEVMYAIKKDLLASILGKSMKDFSDKNSAEYISIFNNDLKLIEDKYITSVFLILRSAVVLVASLSIMLYIQPILSIIAILLSFLPTLIPKLYGEKLGAATAGFTDSLKKYNLFAEDIFRGFDVIKNFSLEHYINTKHLKENTTVKIEQVNMGKKKANADVLTNFIAIGMQFAVFVVSGFFVILKKITAGDVLAITQLMSDVVNPVFNIVDGMNNIQSIKTIEKDILEILDQDNPEGEKAMQLVPEIININHLSFSYTDKEQTISAVSLRLEKGKKYAIVGETGSGKSTLIKLILGYYDNYTGEILFDNVNAKEIKQMDIFSTFSVISQNIFLFEGTIRENITFDQIVDDNEMNNILNLVKLDETLLKKGVDLSYFLTNNGDNLSGGERQKLALARALVRNKKWLLFDEATASMDNETFMQIERMITDLKDISCITITHRYKEEILNKYDEIIVLKKGELVEKGTFAELTQMNGVFHSLYLCENR